MLRQDGTAAPPFDQERSRGWRKTAPGAVEARRAETAFAGAQ
jgi:hypothetical protein